MKKLNNHGWGFVMFIFFLGILAIALLMVVSMVNDFGAGFSSSRGKNVTYGQYQRYKRYEREVASAAYSYSATHGNSDDINISLLNIDNDIKSECSGYASYDESSNGYVAYLRCGNYKSEGYGQ